jgi:hypothetical protein
MICEMCRGATRLSHRPSVTSLGGRIARRRREQREIPSQGVMSCGHVLRRDDMSSHPSLEPVSQSRLQSHQPNGGQTTQHCGPVFNGMSSLKAPSYESPCLN